MLYVSDSAERPRKGGKSAASLKVGGGRNGCEGRRERKCGDNSGTDKEGGRERNREAKGREGENVCVCVCVCFKGTAKRQRRKRTRERLRKETSFHTSLLHAPLSLSSPSPLSLSPSFPSQPQQRRRTDHRTPASPSLKNAPPLPSAAALSLLSSPFLSHPRRPQWTVWTGRHRPGGAVPTVEAQCVEVGDVGGGGGGGN